MPKILIADDEGHMRRLLGFSFEPTGWQLLFAEDGAQALEIALQEQPQVIVMDVMMPVMDGLAALKELKENPLTKAIPVIMLTARGQNLPREEADRSGAALFLTKPFSPSQLVAAARRLMEAASLPPAS